MAEKEVWSMEDLLSLTDEVQTEEIVYKGKTINMQWCELVESEEPKMAMPTEDASEEDKNAYYAKIANEKILAMINKANGKNPDGAFITEEVWSKLPTSLKYQMSAKVMGTASDSDVNF